MVFVSQDQLDLLADVNTWYVDGTFKVVLQWLHPFAQLFSIHGFLGNQQKQVPPAFELMSRRQTSDYTKVFSTILQKLSRRAVVHTIVADFERATWAELRETIPGINIIGCHVHWSQAVWRKVQEVGLQVQYSEDINIYQTVRSILALPFLPIANVQGGFDTIRANAVDNDKLDLLFNYIKRNWIDSSTFPPSTWNVYRKETRSNNDCEGWHRRICCATETAPPMFCLISILFSDSEKLPLQNQMVEDGSLQRVQRRDVRDRKRQYEDLWGQFEEGHLTDIQSFPKIYGPSRL